MRDWFAAFAEEQCPDITKSVATVATLATNDEKSQKPASFGVSDSVASAKSRVATLATNPPPVATVASAKNRVATGEATPRTAENGDFSGVVATVATVASENSRAVEIPDDDACDWRAFYDERAGIAEHLGEASRAEAEARAFECTVVAWLNINPAPNTGPDNCAHCDGATVPGGALPVLNGGRPVWLHGDCHAGWMRRRRGDAVGALRDMGIDGVMPLASGEEGATSPLETSPLARLIAGQIREAIDSDDPALMEAAARLAGEAGPAFRLDEESPF